MFFYKRENNVKANRTYFFLEGLETRTVRGFAIGNFF